MTDIDPLTLNCWARGVDPIDAAIKRIAILIEARDTITTARETNPDAFPLWQSTDPQSLSGRVIATLLNAGWAPPNAEAVGHALRKSADVLESTTDLEILREYGSNRPNGYLREIRASLQEEAELYRRRADELEAS